MFADINGQVLFSGLAKGKWQVSVSLDGFESTSRELEVTAKPGAEQNWGQFTIPKLRTLLVRLIGAETEESFEGYTAKLNYTERSVGFDTDGLARLPVGWFGLPIEVIVKYPDGRHKLSYLHDVMPDSGEEALIRVGGERTLEVGLRYSDEAERVIGKSKCWLRVASKGEGSDRFTSGRAVYGKGDFTFPDIQSAEAEVSFATTFANWPVEWAAAAVELEPEGVTSVTLTVDAPPRRVQLLAREGELLPQFSFRLAREHDATGYVLGNLSDDEGMVELMGETKNGFLMRGSTMDGLRFATDVPLSFDADSEEPAQVVVGPFQDSYLDVEVDGAPESGIYFDFHGRVNGYYHLSQVTNDVGRTGPCLLSTKSQVRVYMDSPEHWWDLPYMDIEPGRNVVKLSRRGMAAAASADTLRQLTSLERGVTVESWIEANKVQLVSDDSGLWSCSLPVGTYSVPDEAAEPQTVEVRTAGVLRL